MFSYIHFEASVGHDVMVRRRLAMLVSIMQSTMAFMTRDGGDDLSNATCRSDLQL